MNLFIVLVVVSVFLNFIQAAPSVDISNDELMDGKYLCEDLSALKKFYNGNSESLRTPGFLSDDISTSQLFNELYKLYLRNANPSLPKNKNLETFQERLSRTVSKRGLDSIGGGHLIKRTESRRLLSD
ncbi:uncharacterized protein LOC128254302 isoform X2 [Drosophila gunungcola]|uniref:uncharacterized protein LOC128254302 isoform X2 n=1 Tax=Drosophila gunungcola TaxID=103775 RepID=UPI0022E101AD|nr:uncharacterized protein LOC128254302 isoform X2 [Drosophila gunungcola]